MKKKKIIFTSILLILVMMFAVTCEADLSEEDDIEYTTVVYSPDGSEITLYLDGVGVPVSRSAQRAVNKALAEMAYDYFEVVFTGSTPAAANTARAVWELGQLPGIYNVPRGATGTGIQYNFASGLAGMFVGKKSDKTLLGIGYLTEARPVLTSPGTVTSIDDKTKAVTFTISAIRTGLLVAGETGGSIPTGVEVTTSSFTFATGGTNDTDYTNLTSSNSIRESVNGSPLKYPRYSLPARTATINATYTFSYVGAGTEGSNNVFTFAHMLNAGTNIPAVKKRTPRFMSGGRYMEPKDGWTTTTGVALATTWGGTNITSGTTLFSAKNVVNLQFSTNGSTGVFSFYIQVPVFLITNVNGGFQLASSEEVPSEVWWIRTGVGSELYSLDDGIANGGCVFMSVGASAANWIDIDWVWL